MFDPPEGQAAYDYVFDFTGEVRHDRTEMVRARTSLFPLLITYPTIIRYKSTRRARLPGALVLRPRSER